MNLLVTSWHAGKPSDIHAVRTMLDTVRGMIETLHPDVIVFAGEGGKGHRHRLHPGYKSSRTDHPPGLLAQIELAKRALDSIGWPLLSSPGFEADDVLATIATRYPGRVTLATGDKDLRQLAGSSRIWHPYKKHVIDSADVEKRFGVGPGQLGDWLALCGDGADDVPGVPGIGPKTATKLLIEFDNLDAVLVAARFRQTGVSAAWTSIADHMASAMLSRKLVELVRTVPLPTGWETWPATRPRVQWIDKLRPLGLGAPAGRLGSVFGDCRRTETTLITPDLSTQPGYRPEDWTVSPIRQGAAEQATDADPQSNPAPESPKSESPASVAATQDDSALPAAVGSVGDGGRVAAGDAPTLKPDERCDNGRLAGRVYQSGQEWAADRPNLAAQAIAGKFSPTSLWGENVGNWSRYWWAGATGQPFPTESIVTTTTAATHSPARPATRRQTSLF